jgi:hypothetical protein
MIPLFDDDGNLPPGIHVATWDEFKRRYGTTRHRRSLLKGLRIALGILRKVGCQRAYVDGSFVTAKRAPQDFDVAWEPDGVDVAKLLRLEPVFGEFDNRRAAQKAKFSGESFPSSATADVAGSTFLEFFQIDKSTGNSKGIVAIDL